MNLFVIRNKRQLLEFIEQLKKHRLPFRAVVDDIYPLRSLDMNAYYFGVALKYISEESGHSVEECHEAYKRKFNLKIEFEYNTLKGIYEPVFGVGSTTVMNSQEFFDYVYRVRADAECEFHIVIPLPSECFIPELDYKHDKIEIRKI